MKILVLSLFSLLLVLGCSTRMTPEQLAKLPPVVIVSLDSTYDHPTVVVNGFEAGYAPKDIYLEVDADGRLPYPVTISVDPKGHSSTHAAALLGSTTGPQVLTKSYAAGRIPPRRIYFDPVVIREDGQATQLAKPGTRSTAERVDP